MSWHVEGPVVVGIDGSLDARRALCLAGDIALGLRTRLVVVHAVDATAHGADVDREVDREDAEEFASWCTSLESVGIRDWESVLRHGDAVETILRTVRETGASLVVVGRQGTGRRDEQVLGSTAHQVAERCPCPTLIVPPVGRSVGLGG